MTIGFEADSSCMFKLPVCGHFAVVVTYAPSTLYLENAPYLEAMSDVLPS